MIFTTAGRPTISSINEAKRLSNFYSGTYIDRNKRSVKDIMKDSQEPVIVYGNNRLYLYVDNSIEPIFFHPNSAMFRCKSLAKGMADPFIEACGLEEGMSLLDCTAGLASDSIVASFVTGVNGRVEALEGSLLALLLQEGLAKWDSGNEEINQAIRRLSITWKRYEEVLPTIPDNAYDVVYFDPMFEETILESDGVQGIRRVALYDGISPEMVTEAKRIAKRRVVLKDFWKSNRFEQLQFHQLVRKTSKFHYGIIEL
ncbi:class I SAM-dependent methyltransferase [Guptibacillus algicola]|uniref:class I SAM-dependent methyltransferase n=1 Tax=Guptibacillus algicola TaxID=225844 RepID=UPI001CD71A93|nr:class I SAM-dependent methyltransferase [Alkalihalobacillus algicola]MCA0988292.1 class I SAM-dependent methyltransferase [Alkalihalobacillus algicola]